MMHIIFFKYSNATYIKDNISNNHLDPLAHFLAESAGPIENKFFKKWLASSSLATGNASQLKKHEHGGIIEVTCRSYSEHCFITQVNFSQLLDQWATFNSTFPPCIMLYEEDNKFLLARYEEQG